MSVLVSVTVPEGLVGIVTLALDGEDVSCYYRPVTDVVQPPRRQTAAALRLLADYLEHEAVELEGGA